MDRFFKAFYHPPDDKEGERQNDQSQGSPSSLSSLPSSAKSALSGSPDLESWFDVDEEQDDPAMKRRSRILIVLHHWLLDYPEDFSVEMKRKLAKFLAHATSLYDIMAVRTLRRTFEREDQKKPQAVNPPPRRSMGSLDILRTSPSELARELTLIDFAFFKRIQQLEFVDQRWQSKDKSLAPNAQFFISQFNRLSYWVATEILYRKTVLDRVLIIQHFLNIATDSLKLHNFHTAFAIAAALASHPVFRLKDLRNVLDSHYQKLSDNLSKITSSDDNYKAYRPLLKQCVDKGVACLPHMAVTFKDLFMFEEPTAYERENKVVDLHRLDRVTREVSTVVALTKRDYTSGKGGLKSNQPLQDALREQVSRARTEEELMQRSLELEPKMTWQQHREHRQQMAINVLLEEGFL